MSSKNRTMKRKRAAAKRPSKTHKSGHPGGRPGKVAPATARDWIEGARLRTLPLAVSGVALGTGAAVVYEGDGIWHPVRAALCLLVAVFLQIGVNFANDYSDGVRGTDAYRTGPPRLTGSGKAKPRTVLIVACAFLALAAIAGLVLIVDTGRWWALLVGAAAIAAAWFYTGGKRPYGYYGLGELAVFLFFGLVETAGTTYMLTGGINQEALVGGGAVGLLACAVLVANNLRDIDADRQAGKRTLTVLIGSLASRILYCVFVFVAFAVAALFSLVYPLGLFVFFVLLLAIPAAIIVVTAKSSRELVLALKLTSLTSLAYGLILGAAFAF